VPCPAAPAIRRLGYDFRVGNLAAELREGFALGLKMATIRPNMTASELARGDQ
jgi:hypothetical protein